MIRTLSLLFLTLSMAAAAPQSGWSVYLRRAGPIRIGMSLEHVRSALSAPGASIRGNPREPDSGGCAYLSNAPLPAGAGVMFENRRVVRIDIRAPSSIRTASGAGIGDTEDKVRDLYPERIRVEPHKYDSAGHYLVYVASDPADREYGLIFETDGTRVTSFRAGLLSAVELVEGCG